MCHISGTALLEKKAAWPYRSGRTQYVAKTAMHLLATPSVRPHEGGVAGAGPASGPGVRALCPRTWRCTVTYTYVAWTHWYRFGLRTFEYYLLSRRPTTQERVGCGVWCHRGRLSRWRVQDVEQGWLARLRLDRRGRLLPVLFEELYLLQVSMMCTHNRGVLNAYAFVPRVSL